MIIYQNPSEHFSNNTAFSLMRNSHNSELHFHGALEFVYLVEGELSITLNGNAHKPQKEELLLINSSVVHGFQALKNPVDYYVLIVSDDFLKKNNLYSENSLYSVQIQSNQIKNLFKEIISESAKSDDYSNLSIISKIIAIFIELNRKRENHKINHELVDNKKLAMVRDTLNFLSENYKEKLTVLAISKHLNYSKSYLSHAFKDITGYTLIEYLNVIRCYNARILLLEGYSVSEVAYNCGFSDLSYFTRTFKKTTGISPSKAKNEIFAVYNHSKLN